MASGTLAIGRGNIQEVAQKGRSPLRDAWKQLLKNKAAVISGWFVIFLVILGIFADTLVLTWFTGGEAEPLLAPQRYDGANFAYTDDPPFTRTDDGQIFLFGTDYLGRDNLSRAIYGIRISLAVAVVASTVSLVVGLIYGLISGYGSSQRDNLMMRFVDFLYGFPLIIFIILIQVFVKAWSNRQEVSEAATWFGSMMNTLVGIDRAMGGIFFLFVAIGLINWLGMARIARGQTLSLKEKEFVEAARAVGTSEWRIIFRHILPNILGPCIVFETLAIPGYISLEAFLSFIGLGVNPPVPSWGIMISETYSAMRVAPWEVFVPAAALTLTTLAFNFLGDGVRDAFDPRLRGS